MFGFLTPQLLGIFSMISQGIGTVMQVRAQKQSAKYEQQRLQSQADQYEDQAQRAILEANATELERKRQYFQTVSTNRALMSTTGVSSNSASFRALMQANQNTMKDDMGAIALAGIENRMNSMYSRDQALMSKKSAKHTKADVFSTVSRNLIRAKSTFDETF